MVERIQGDSNKGEGSRPGIVDGSDSEARYNSDGCAAVDGIPDRQVSSAFET